MPSTDIAHSCCDSAGLRPLDDLLCDIEQRSPAPLATEEVG
jgi:hypothetical protein